MTVAATKKALFKEVTIKTEKVKLKNPISTKKRNNNKIKIFINNSHPKLSILITAIIHLTTTAIIITCTRIIMMTRKTKKMNIIKITIVIITDIQTKILLLTHKIVI